MNFKIIAAFLMIASNNGVFGMDGSIYDPTTVTHADETFESHIHQTLSLLRNRGIRIHLNLDVNGVIAALDGAQGKTADDIAYSYIAENVRAIWEDQTEEMLYCDYIKQSIRHIENKKEKKQAQKVRYTQILEALSRATNATHDARWCEGKIQDVRDAMADQEGIVLPSTYQLIETLKKSDVDFTISLRSFGTDTIDVYTELLNKTTLTPGISIEFKGEDLYHSSSKIGDISSLARIMSEFSKGSLNIISCDYEHWSAYNELKEAGKPISVMTLRDHGTISMVIDDNIATKEIIRPVGTNLPYQTLIESGILSHIDTVDGAILDKYSLVKLMMKAIDWNLAQVNSPVSGSKRTADGFAEAGK